MPITEHFGTLVMGPSSDSFINLFESSWKQHLSSFPQKYRQGQQLQGGSRFRPLLVAWGYLLSGGEFELAARLKTSKLAIYVELLHKATLLIDDLIDGDKARHGLPAFHVEFSDHEAILFAIWLLGDCFEVLAAAARAQHGEQTHSDISDLLIRAIKDMAFGGLEEINLSNDELGSIEKIKRIMELQTTALVRNGLLVGYRYGHGDAKGDQAIDSLGYDAGYLFQALNDLEPFFGARLNTEYKGGENTDVSRLRKNLTVAALLSKLNAMDQQEFCRLSASSDRQLSVKCSEWLHKYGVFECLAQNLAHVRQNICMSITTLQIERDRRDGFVGFIDYVLSKALARLDAAPRHKLFEMLMT